MEYNTLTEAEAKIEAHRQYVDIQVLLSGKENVRCFPATALETTTQYDDQTGCGFLLSAEQYPVELHLKPGYLPSSSPTTLTCRRSLSTIFLGL